MNAYWIEYVEILLPDLILQSISAIPLALGTLLAIRHLRADRRGPYIRHLCGSIAAGVVLLWLLWSSLFGDNLSSSSTAGLIFLFAPIYSAIALLVGYLIGVTIDRTSNLDNKSVIDSSIATRERKLIWLPVLILAIVLFGIAKYSILNNDVGVAAHGVRSETLDYVFEKAARGKPDAFGVSLFLAQNPNTPADLLEKLSKSDESQVRAFVATNPNTSASVLASLRDDCADHVRKAVRERLKDVSSSSSVLHSPSKCDAGKREDQAK